MAKNKITRFGDSGHQLVDEDGKTRIIKQFKPGPHVEALEKLVLRHAEQAAREFAEEPIDVRAVLRHHALQGHLHGWVHARTRVEDTAEV